MDELNKRYPVPDSDAMSSSFNAERYFIQRMEAERHAKMVEINSLRDALTISIQALNDWTATYASEQCSDEMVESAYNRIAQYGTIAYIADVVKQNHDALRTIHGTRNQSESESSKDD